MTFTALIVTSSTLQGASTVIIKYKKYRKSKTNKYPDDYYRKTKRKLHPHKIARILTLLSEYNIIEKIERWDKETKRQRPSLFKIGSKNFYKRELKCN